MPNLEAKNRWFGKSRTGYRMPIWWFSPITGHDRHRMNALRAKFRTAGAEYRVVKNTLTRLALKNAGLEELLPYIEGPNAVVFSSSDPVESARYFSTLPKPTRIWR